MKTRTAILFASVSAIVSTANAFSSCQAELYYRSCKGGYDNYVCHDFLGGPAVFTLDPSRQTSTLVYRGTTRVLNCSVRTGPLRCGANGVYVSEAVDGHLEIRIQNVLHGTADLNQCAS